MWRGGRGHGQVTGRQGSRNHSSGGMNQSMASLDINSGVNKDWVKNKIGDDELS